MIVLILKTNAGNIIEKIYKKIYRCECQKLDEQI